MAFNSIITHAYDLTGPLRITPLSHSLVSGDDKGDRFEVSVLSGGAPVPLTGGSVMGYFLREGDGATIPIPGEISGSVAAVVLPEACYAVTGRFSLVIKVSLGGARHAVYACEGAVLRSMTDSIVDPSHNIPDLQELLALIDQMEQATSKANTATSKANAAAASAEAATKQANAAAKEAEEQTARAQRAADEAEAARHVTDRAADGALEAADKANSAADRVDAGVAAAEEALEEAHTAANRADEAIGLAQGAIKEAAGAADEAHAAGAAANDAAARAMEAASVAEKWGRVTATVEMLDPEHDPVVTVTDTETGKSLEFRLPRGLTGLTPDITIGEVITGEPGSDAQAWLTGSAEARVLHLSIPRGDVGEIGHLTICGKSPDAGGELTLTAEDVGARPDDWTPTAEDVGARPDDWLPTAEDIGALPSEASGVEAGSYGPKTNVAPGFGGTFVVPGFAVDEHGIVTASADRIITLPAAPGSVTGSAGMLSMPRYGTFNLAEQARVANSYYARAFYVEYSGAADGNAPVKTSGTYWWNVIEWGLGSRLVQLAVNAFGTRSTVYMRVKHDTTWYGWYAIAGTTVSTASAADAGAVAFARLAEMGAIDAVTAGEHADVFDVWQPGVSYTVGQLRRYEDKLYRCLQAHTSQSDWTPDVTPALWELIADQEA